MTLIVIMSIFKEFLKKSNDDHKIDYYDKYTNLNDNLKCIICYNNTYNFIMSCGHAGVCDSCLIHLQKSNYSNKCIICKQKISYIKLFRLIEGVFNINDNIDVIFESKLDRLLNLEELVTEQTNRLQYLETVIKEKTNKLQNLEQNIKKKVLLIKKKNRKIKECVT